MKAAVVVAGVVLGLSVTAGAGARPNALVSFRMPSKNIFCMYDSSYAYLRCDINSGLRPRPPKPASCEFDWGGSVNMRRGGRSHVGCVSDSVYSSTARVLRYGTTWKRGGFTCTSRAAGLTCRNASGHGWFLSRQHSRPF